MKKVSKPPIVVKNNDSEEKQEDIKITTIKNSTNIIYQDNMDFSKFKTDIKTRRYYYCSNQWRTRFNVSSPFIV